jgi:hypothetical protein
MTNSKYKLNRINPISASNLGTNSNSYKKLISNKKVVSKFKLINNTSVVKSTLSPIFKGFNRLKNYHPAYQASIGGKIKKMYKYKRKKTSKQINKYKLVNNSFKTSRILNIRGYQFKLDKSQKKLSRLERSRTYKKQNIASKYVSRFKLNNYQSRFKYFKAANNNQEPIRKDMNRLILAKLAYIICVFIYIRLELFLLLK